MNTLSLLPVLGLAALAAGSAVPRATSLTFEDGIVAQAGGMHNVHVTYNTPLNGELSLHYGSCEAVSSEDCHHTLGRTHVGSHPLAKRHHLHEDHRPNKFVWLPPKDIASGGCLHAFSGGVLVGRSTPVEVQSRKQKRWVAAADIMDAEGPWFDGVAYLQEKEPDEVFVAAAKSKTIGILGGGMSGLMTSHVLESVGFHDWKIIEASNRIGGRVHTSYLNGTEPSDYQYQEMGPMRFPVSVTYDDPAETIQINDHRMVFQLAEVLNKQNGNNSEYAVNFIKWIQSAANDPSSTSERRPDGTVPGTAEVAANPAYSTNANLTYSNATAVAEAAAAYDKWMGLDRDAFRAIATNVYKAHKWSVDNGYFHFSEAGYLNYALGISANITDQVDDISDADASWAYDSVYFSATEWLTIDQGLSRLPHAFTPAVQGRIQYNTTVQGLAWDETTSKMSVQYRSQDNLLSTEPESQEFDYVVVAVPFSRVRLWRLPSYTNLLSRAIARLNYDPSCKVALHYKTRFWEHLDHPINGGCGSTNIPQISSICYPSYQINSTGPGVLLASYISGTGARSVGSMTEEQHVAHVQRAMVEVHGPIAAEQYTGNYDRICWEYNEFQAGAWAGPKVGQQDLYLPAYFHTEKHTVFVGEHTSFTHAWIWSALESAVRGTSQLLLDMGCVDEAKEIVETWMARWIDV
ncbi:Putative amine oxidase, FAD/NAD(P)-binding domain superfamily [Septoria linicola]|uniref:Amine oxidase, FAD/NAD(P)-binding domain superfamily n=1 Tax=Septoria linicola TaxID=215465 RepID=A0A9Q9ARH3_9PEZI|nr:Putative amine oxidase, FAD/NAD(P)-binding domain superfamily [Septoria linicola]